MATIPEATRPPDEVQDLIAGDDSPVDIPGDTDDYFNSEVMYLLKTQIIDSLKTNTGQRRTYAIRTFILTCVWIFLVIIIVALTGVEFNNKRVLVLSDTVIVTLITTTTLNVFGFFLLVMKYLFNTEELKELKDIFLNK